MRSNKKTYYTDPNDPKIIRLQSFCSMPEGFANPFSAPGTKYPVMAEEVQKTKLGWGDIREQKKAA